MKIIFLDFDGVLNSKKFIEKRGDYSPRYALFDESADLDPEAGQILLKILNEVPEVKIVVSSTWRLGRTVEQLRDLLEVLKIPRDRVISKTVDRTDHYERGYEIEEWLNENKNVTHFVILDDDSDMVHLSHRHIKTKWEVGLIEEQADLAIKMLTE